MKNKILVPLLTFGYTFIWRINALADDNGNGNGTGDIREKGPIEWTDDVKSGVGTRIEDLQTWLPQLLNIMIGLAALVAIAVLVVSGYMYITAAGDETKVEKATKSMTYAIIGLVIAFISAILVEFVLKQILLAEAQPELGGTN
jgi:type IV secretory pathway VirB2 component (pilin)